MGDSTKDIPYIYYLSEAFTDEQRAGWRQEDMMAWLADAEALAREAHTGQRERFGGGPFVRHLERVVALTSTYDEKVVAWLHDLFEDTDRTEADLHGRFLPAHLHAVRTLTHIPGISYAAYIETIIASGDELAIAVKVADLVDHLRPESPPEAAVLYPRYARALQRLAQPRGAR